MRCIQLAEGGAFRFCAFENHAGTRSRQLSYLRASMLLFFPPQVKKTENEKG